MKKTLSAIASLALCTALSAQNINQSVQVTNDYVTRFADFQKLGGGLQVPDSLYRFDYDFDYSVFETPYKGSYEFSPYRIRVTPEPRPLDAGRLYLRAGAGYVLRPQFDLVWQAVQRKNGAVGVVAGLSGYSGRYRISDALLPAGTENPGAVRGHDLTGSFGVNGHYLAPAVRLSGQLGYEGIFSGLAPAADADLFKSAFNVLTLRGGIRSRERAENRLFYELDARYRHGAGAYGAGDRAAEDGLRLAVSAGPVLRQKYRILLDAVFEMDAVSDLRDGGASSASGSVLLASAKPHVEFLLGDFRLDAGARLDYSLSEAAAGPASGFTLSPDVSARLPLVGVNLELFAGVSGGQAVQGLYDAVRLNHFSRGSVASASVVREKLRLRAGLEGHWGARLQYGLEGGYVSYSGRQLPSWLSVVRTDYRAAYAQARMSWKDERFEMDGRMGYVYARFSGSGAAFAPPAFTADLRGVYNWQRKVHAGAFLRAASSRAWLGGDATIPGYADLGLTGEVRISRSLAAWIEAGNLLGMAIERTPGVVEKSPYATVGVSLKL